MYDVFISYSSEDIKVAKAVVKCLEANKIKCWIAYRDAQTGIEFAASIIDAIKRTKMTLLILTRSSNASKHCLREIDAAVKYEKTVVAFKIEEVRLTNALEYYLSTTHWLVATSGSLESHFKKLVVETCNHLGRSVRSTGKIDKRIKSEIKKQKKEIKKQKKEIKKLQKKNIKVKKKSLK